MGPTSARTEDSITAIVGYLDHHAAVHHAVGGLEAAVDADVAGVKVGHSLDGIEA